MELKLYFSTEEQITFLIRNGYEIKDVFYDKQERLEVWIKGEVLFYHWNKRDFCKYDQVNSVFTQLIKDKLLEL